MRDVTIPVSTGSAGTTISTHTSHAGRDGRARLFRVIKSEFLLTRPMREVTSSVCLRRFHPGFLLTRPMRDVTLFPFIRQFMFVFLLTRPMRDVTSIATQGIRAYYISTHTSHAGRDARMGCYQA